MARPHLGSMAGGLYCIGCIKGVVGEGHVEEVALCRLAELCHAHLRCGRNSEGSHWLDSAAQDTWQQSHLVVVVGTSVHLVLVDGDPVRQQALSGCSCRPCQHTGIK